MRDIWQMSVDEREEVWREYAALCSQAAYAVLMNRNTGAGTREVYTLVVASDGRWMITQGDCDMSDPIMVVGFKHYDDCDALYQALIDSRKWATLPP